MTALTKAPFKIASWNVNSLKVRLPHVLQWLEKTDMDILVLQETKCIDENFPQEEIEAAGYQVVYSGQKTYNGVALLCKENLLIEDVVFDLPNLDDPQRRILAATVNGIRILDLYVVNGSEVGSEKFAYKLNWLEKVTAWIDKQPSNTTNLSFWAILISRQKIVTYTILKTGTSVFYAQRLSVTHCKKYWILALLILSGCLSKKIKPTAGGIIAVVVLTKIWAYVSTLSCRVIY